MNEFERGVMKNIWDETLMENVQCYQPPKIEDNKSSIVDGDWWLVLWVFCFCYELPKVFMSDIV